MLPNQQRTGNWRLTTGYCRLKERVFTIPIVAVSSFCRKFDSTPLKASSQSRSRISTTSSVSFKPTGRHTAANLSPTSFAQELSRQTRTHLLCRGVPRYIPRSILNTCFNLWLRDCHRRHRHDKPELPVKQGFHTMKRLVRIYANVA